MDDYAELRKDRRWLECEARIWIERRDEFFHLSEAWDVYTRLREHVDAAEKRGARNQAAGLKELADELDDRLQRRGVRAIFREYLFRRRWIPWQHRPDDVRWTVESFIRSPSADIRKILPAGLEARFVTLIEEEKQKWEELMEELEAEVEKVFKPFYDERERFKQLAEKGQKAEE